MDILEIIKKLVPELTDEQVGQLGAIMDLAGYTSVDPNATTDPNADPAADPGMKPTRSIDTARLAIDLKSMGYTVVLPGQGRPAKTARPVFSSQPAADPAKDGATKAMDAAYTLKFGEEGAEKKAILAEVIGPNYRQDVYEQNLAFGKYIRQGERNMDVNEMKALRRMIFPTDQIIELSKNGLSISDIKATQVEAQGELGGFAVPPNVQTELTTRLPGRTAVRGGGARVVQLINSNSLEIPLYRGTDNRYVGTLRGQWGNETAVPGAQNFKLDLETIVAHVYTYKVPMSQSLVEDAANLVQILQQDIQDTMAIDEDEAFLVGAGVGKPRGILPGKLNPDLLKEVVSGSAAAVTTNGVKALKRGVPSQYRDENAIWVATSDTFGAIEVLTVGGGNLSWAFPDLSEDEKLLNRRVFESEAMDQIATGKYVTIFGNMRGYTIVERLGMTIQRFQDSATGPNLVEYHVRRRLGGRTERPWMFAVQKISA